MCVDLHLCLIFFRRSNPDFGHIGIIMKTFLINWLVSAHKLKVEIKYIFLLWLTKVDPKCL